MDTRKDRVGEDEYSVAKICCCCTAGLAFPVEQEVVVCYPLGYGFPFSKPALSSVPSCYLDSWSPPLPDLSFSAICLNVCVCVLPNRSSLLVAGHHPRPALLCTISCKCSKLSNNSSFLCIRFKSACLTSQPTQCPQLKVH